MLTQSHSAAQRDASRDSSTWSIGAIHRCDRSVRRQSSQTPTQLVVVAWLRLRLRRQDLDRVEIYKTGPASGTYSDLCRGQGGLAVSAAPGLGLGPPIDITPESYTSPDSQTCKVILPGDDDPGQDSRNLNRKPLPLKLAYGLAKCGDCGRWEVKSTEAKKAADGRGQTISAPPIQHPLPGAPRGRHTLQIRYWRQLWQRTALRVTVFRARHRRFFQLRIHPVLYLAPMFFDPAKRANLRADYPQLRSCRQLDFPNTWDSSSKSALNHGESSRRIGSPQTERRWVRAPALSTTAGLEGTAP
jgi:hypothetical protein